MLRALLLKKLKSWPYLLLPLLGACVLMRTGTDSDPAAAKKTAPESLLAAVQFLSGGVGQQAQSILEDLDRAETTANTGELYAIKKLRPLIEQLQEKDPSLKPRDNANAAKVMNLVARDHPEDFDLQLATTKGLDFIGNILHSNATKASSPEEEGSGAPNALSRALSLVGKFPNQSRAHAHLAEVLAVSGGDQVTAMRSFVRCLQLDPNNRDCRSGLKSLAAEYSRPRCREYKQSGFAVHRAGVKAAGSKSRKFTVDKLELFIDGSPLLTGVDIAEVVAASSNPAQSLVTLKPNAAARFEVQTEDVAKTEGYLVILLNGKAVGAPRVLSPVSNGQLSLSVSGSKLDGVCKSFDTRKLPADVVGILR